MARFSAGLDPDGAGGAELALPDRNPRLDRLDSSPTGGEGLGPVGSGGRDHHCDITHHESANSMAEKHLCVRMTVDEVPRDAGHLLFGHRAVRFVLQPIHPVPFVFVAHDAYEKGEPPVFAAPNDSQQRAGIQRVRREEVHGNMIRPEAGIER
jgi:hypothetical protein